MMLYLSSYTPASFSPFFIAYCYIFMSMLGYAECSYSQSIEDDHVAGACSGLMQDSNPDATGAESCEPPIILFGATAGANECQLDSYIEVTHVSPIKSFVFSQVVIQCSNGGTLVGTS